jgi:RES domain-containing protein
MRRVWRMTKWPGLDGAGGLTGAGRWHRIGRPVIYACEHPALATLEVLVNMRMRPGEVPVDYKLMAIDILDHAAVSPAPDLPDGWQANEPSTQAVGTRWLDELSGLVLPVPSAVVPHAQNYLLNPRHEHAASHLKVAGVEPVWLDSRLLR